MAQPHLRTHSLVTLLQSTDRPRNLLRPPEWLARMLDGVCDHIEPVTGEARVGYELTFQDSTWRVEVFLGRTALVGGSLDGSADCVSFTANIPGILSLFTKVESCEWLALPSSMDAGCDEDSSSLLINALCETERIRLTLRSSPPSTAEAGLRRHADGRLELI